jgi:hypothetical protein
MRKSVGQAPTAGEQTQQKPCQTSSDIGAGQEKYYCRTRSDVGSERANLIPIRSENISRERKERSKAVPTFPSIFKRCLFLKKTLKMLSIAKTIFFIIQSAKKKKK